MKLSVSCPRCGKKFENIKPELVGKKAKCSCGKVIRIEAKPAKKPQPPASQDDDLLSVDLLGDELLGDQLLGGDLPVSDSEPRRSPAPSSPIRQPANSKPEQRSKRPVKELVPEVKVSVSGKPKKRPSSNADGPVFASTYDDLDSILEGTGDAAPIMARPQTSHQSDDQDRSEGSGETVKKQGSLFSFLVALLSATLAFWFGLFVVVSRFSSIDQILVRGFSQAYHSVFSATFESAEVPSGFESLFVGIGWLVWAAGLCLMIFGAAQFINAFYKTLSNGQIFKWSDGLVATFGVAAVFATVALLLVQYSFQQDRHKFFDDYEKSALGEEGGHLESVIGLRAEMDSQQNGIRNWLIVGAVLPMTIFVLSMLRLFFKPPDELPTG